MYLRYVHGSFNLTVALLVFYQLKLGLGIKKARARGAGATDVRKIKKHRQMGPIAVAAGLLGFTAGTTLIMLDKGNVLVYPLHFVTGGLIALGLAFTFILSRKMLSGDASVRTLHGKVGIGIATLYVFQVFMGIGILL